MTRPDLFATPWEAQDNTVIAIHKGQAYRIASTKNKLFTIKAEETHARAIAAIPETHKALERALATLERLAPSLESRDVETVEIIRAALIAAGYQL